MTQYSSEYFIPMELNVHGVNLTCKNDTITKGTIFVKNELVS